MATRGQTPEDPLRGTGRTTGLMLVAIGKAMLAPDEWVEFVDHAPASSWRRRQLAKGIKAFVASVMFTIDTKVTKTGVALRSPITRMREQYRKEYQGEMPFDELYAEDPLRNTGRTTGLMLIAIGKAMLAPDEWVEFVDHRPTCRWARREIAKGIRMFCAGMFTIDTKVTKTGVALRSPITRMRAQRGKRLGPK